MALGDVRRSRRGGRGSDGWPQLHLAREGAAYRPRSGGTPVRDLADPTDRGNDMMKRKPALSVMADPLWYKDAVIYQLHVKSFFDSNNDGVGDFPGLFQKLDYIADLGVNAIWLLPFYPSPRLDDGYDIAEYTGVHPEYGTLDDVERYLYVWSDNDQKYSGTRVIFLDTQRSNWTWDPAANAYYWHRFYAHQPDLNFDNPAVLEAVLKVMRFWLERSEEHT